MNYPLFVSCAKGLEYLLAEELKTLHFHVTQISPQGVYGDANLATLYHLCLWSRLANRVQLILFTGDAYNERTLYTLCNQFHWQTVFTSDKTLAIEFHGVSTQLRNAMFAGQVVKDAIVDHFRQFKGSRPSVDRHKPQILIHAYLKRDTVTVSLDLIGYSLHQRGYRQRAGEAPLKETLAAAMLMRAGWAQLAANGYALHDPFCGAGTLVIEAAMIAAHIAPGLIRHDQALIHWVQHQPSLWEKIRSQALQQVRPNQFKLLGTDSNAKLITIAKDNAKRAGVLPLVEFAVQTVENCQAKAEKGLLITNPPYGERLGEPTQLIPLYQKLGSQMRFHYQGWKAAILTSSPTLAKAIGLSSNKQYTLFNGPLECKLYCFILHANNRFKGEIISLSAGGKMLTNRLQKNQNHLIKWAKRNQISCYRIYDADLPEYAYAVDVYDDYVVLQEYAAPASIPPLKAQQRSLEFIQAVPKALGISLDKLIIKQRKPQRGHEQYQKLNKTDRTLIVCEGKAKFKVNLYDYLDTGLFLDHRLLRQRFSELAKKTRFLNCFCYTASASVHAALAGAVTTNVDLSKTYLSWAIDNFKLNALDPSRHRFEQADCLTWMQRCRERFDVIFIDPPTFSNSKRTIASFDVQRDHVTLINTAMRLLEPNGILYFSTNSRRFKLDEELAATYVVTDMTKETIDLDFKRSPRIHKCYKISKIT